jgi:hypothetical protein
MSPARPPTPHNRWRLQYVESAEPEPGPGWLRSRLLGHPWPREGVAACGRASCPVCDRLATAAQKGKC